MTLIFLMFKAKQVHILSYKCCIISADQYRSWKPTYFSTSGMELIVFSISFSSFFHSSHYQVGTIWMPTQKYDEEFSWHLQTYKDFINERWIKDAGTLDHLIVPNISHKNWEISILTIKKMQSTVNQPQRIPKKQRRKQRTKDQETKTT